MARSREATTCWGRVVRASLCEAGRRPHTIRRPQSVSRLGCAVLIAIGVDWEGRRQVLAVELANRESRSRWKEFLEALKARGLHGVEFVVSDDHPGLKKAIAEVLAGVFWQRCYVHFLRNALDYVPRKVDENCLLELRWMTAWLAKWGGK